MILFKQASHLSQFIAQRKNKGKSVGFVPTMGALHDGHLSLLAAAAREADVTVCSIFVNPTQFNNPDDFAKYPVTLEQDIERLTKAGCDVLFLPSAGEVYPEGYNPPHYELEELEIMLEGRYRPGHFQGVCQVVDRLLQIVNPDVLFLGQKDYQQCRVIQRLLALTGRRDIALVISPTIREADGLAMSSRNLRLTPEQRTQAPALYQELDKARNTLHIHSLNDIKANAIESLTQNGFRVDYFDIVDADTLHPLIQSSQPAVVLVAAYLGDIRLIDNLPLNHGS